MVNKNPTLASEGVFATKKGFFFSADALIAVIFVLFVMILMSTYYSTIRSTPQPIYHSADIAQIIATVQLHELQQPEVVNIITNVSDKNRTLLEQVLRFQIEGEPQKATDLLNATLRGVIPEPYEIGVWIEGYTNPVYATAVPGTVQMVSVKQLVSGVERDKITEGVSARALLSSIDSQSTSSIVYFGGYEGDGNITKVVSLPSSLVSVHNATMELDAGSSFNLYINNAFAGRFVSNHSIIQTWYLNSSQLSMLVAGNNNLLFVFQSVPQYISGGYIRIDYSVSDIVLLSAQNIQRFSLPGINGLINYYSSFFVPGAILNMSAYLHYLSGFDVFLNIGNKTVYVGNASGEQTVNIPDDELRQLLNYANYGSKTVPLRFGLRNVTSNPYGFSGTADTALITDVSGSMGQESKLAIAKAADKEFVDVVLAVTGNRVGLVSYSNPTQDVHEVSNDSASLKSEIDTYKSGGNKCICCGILNATYIFQTQSSSAKKKSMLVMSDGKPNKDCNIDPVQDYDDDGDITSDPEDHAIQAACDAYNIHNITVYSVGFGSLPQGAVETLRLIAECGHGEFAPASAQNVTTIYRGIAQKIVQLSYISQQLAAEEDFTSTALYPDSYLEMVYDAPDNEAYGRIPIVVESPRFGNNISQGSFSVPSNIAVYDARITSYSGDKWTHKASVKQAGQWVPFFNLQQYNLSYVELGDPYAVNIPLNLVAQAENDVQISAGITPQNDSGGSAYNRVIYTGGIDIAINYSGIFEKAEGCKWQLSFEDGSQTSLNIPNSYSGGTLCTYNAATDCGTYTIDAINSAVCNLFSQLDMDKDGKLLVRFGADDLLVDSVVVARVPFMWGPTSVEVRVWR